MVLEVEGAASAGTAVLDDKDVDCVEEARAGDEIDSAMMVLVGIIDGRVDERDVDVGSGVVIEVEEGIDPELVGLAAVIVKAVRVGATASL